jgi:hypothetical protein
MLVAIFARRRYSTPEYVARLLRLNYGATNSRFKELREDTMRVLKLCDIQQVNAGLRMTGYLYYELDSEGYAILVEEGVKLKQHKIDGQFAHTLARDLFMLSIEIGVAEDSDIEMRYRDDLPRSFRLGKDKYMVCDEMPVTFRSISRGTERHLAGIEVETGANSIAPKDANDASVIKKLKNIIWLIESGELERTHRFGKQVFFGFIFRTLIRKESAMEYLERMTRHDPTLRKHFLFKTHPIFGKSKDKPRATGHAFNEPWDRVKCEPLYLNGGKSARQ